MHMYNGTLKQHSFIQTYSFVNKRAMRDEATCSSYDGGGRDPSRGNCSNCGVLRLFDCDAEDDDRGSIAPAGTPPPPPTALPLGCRPTAAAPVGVVEVTATPATPATPAHKPCADAHVVSASELTPESASVSWVWGRGHSSGGTAKSVAAHQRVIFSARVSGCMAK